MTEFMRIYLTQERDQAGFMTPEDMVMHYGIEQNNHFVVPYDTLIATKGVQMGQDNYFGQGVQLRQRGDGIIIIGDRNRFDQDCVIDAGPGQVVRIGNGGRYQGGVEILGSNILGNGSQILGRISIRRCLLDGGATFECPEPNERGAVLKGFGALSEVTLLTGQVMNGETSNIADAPVEMQSAYHPQPA